MSQTLVAIVAAERADAAIALLRDAGETAWRVGEIVERRPDAPQTLVV